MKRTTIENPATGRRVAGRRTAGRRTAGRLAWFVGLWLAGVTTLGGIAYVLRKIILG